MSNIIKFESEKDKWVNEAIRHLRDDSDMGFIVFTVGNEDFGHCIVRCTEGLVAKHILNLMDGLSSDVIIALYQAMVEKTLNMAKDAMNEATGATDGSDT